MEDALNEQSKNRHPSEDKPWLFKPGQSGNPAGRPPGPSLKEYAKKYLAGLTEEERMEYLAGLDKKVIWEMAEGKPKQDTESNLNVHLPKPLLDNVRNNNSDEEVTETQEED